MSELSIFIDESGDFGEYEENKKDFARKQSLKSVLFAIHQ